MKLVVLSGGTGTPKLIQGLLRLLDPSDLTIVGNTGEDLEVGGMWVSPDLDTILYTCAGVINEETWYGIRGDTFHEYDRLRALGHREILKIGDEDRANKRFRADCLRRGMTLSQATDKLREKYGVKVKILPMSNDRVTTRILTDEGELSFHEFWVLRGGRVEVKGVKFIGSEHARPAPGVLEAIREADWILIGPSNPITSIGPILSVPQIREELKLRRHRVMAVSPIIDHAPVSGPAGVLMRGLGLEVSPVGVAQVYRDVAHLLFVDQADAGMVRRITELGIRAYLTSLLMPDLQSRIRLARVILDYCRQARTG